MLTLLRVFNTLTRRLERFSPREGKKVMLFTCGPSVYRRPHIGNYRTFLYEDLLQRYLEYLGYDVTRLITLTDIEDKAIVEAQKEQIAVKELAERNRRIFVEDTKLLRMRSPTYSACMMVCSSTAVDEVAKLIQALLGKGHAYYYRHQGRRNVYFDPFRFDGFGKLAHLDMRTWPQTKRRFHKDTYPGTPWNKGDFILWHGYQEGDVDFWDTPIGKGRPSWNIQDAATIAKYLGFTVDVACGGIDNLVRHHDYTIAIMESVSGQALAQYWLHGQHLLVDGQKMSKSRGNVYYPDDLIKIGYTGGHIRFFLAYGHYRNRLNFTLEKMQTTSAKLDEFQGMVRLLRTAQSNTSGREAQRLVGALITAFEQHMNHDLDVKAAFDALFSAVTKLDSLRKRGKLSSADAQAAADNLRKLDSVLQFVY